MNPTCSPPQTAQVGARATFELHVGRDRARSRGRDGRSGACRARPDRPRRSRASRSASPRGPRDRRRTIIGSPVFSIAACCKSWNVSTGAPSIALTTSPTSNPRSRRGRTRLDEADPRAVLGPAESHEQRGENHDRENEIGDRAGRDDRGAIAQRLAGQGVRAARPATSPPRPRASGALAALASP